jgi:hypothetical protein
MLAIGCVDGDPHLATGHSSGGEEQAPGIVGCDRPILASA